MDQPASTLQPVLPPLREATGEAHQRLEDAVDIVGCIADRDRYTSLLRDFLGFYRPLEEHLSRLTGWEEHGLGLAARRKTPWLEADLLALGLSTEEIAALPDSAALPPTHSLAAGFGCLYVLEGATLGGRQITALLQNSPVPPAARRFFNSYGADTGRRWKEFLAALEQQADSGDAAARAETIDAARETFTCLHAWVVRECHRHER